MMGKDGDNLSRLMYSRYSTLGMNSDTYKGRYPRYLVDWKAPPVRVRYCTARP